MADETLGDIRSVEDFREYHGDAANNMTNERITEKMYDAFLKDGNYKTGGYYEFSKAFDKESPYSSIEKYRELYSEKLSGINQMDNLDVADAAYKELKRKGGAPEFKVFLEQFAPRKAGGKKYVPEGAGQGDFIPYEFAVPYTEEELAKKFNVDTDPDDLKVMKARIGLDLARNETRGLEYVKSALSDKFKTNVDIRRGPRTGAVEFYDPVKKKYTLLNQPGADLADVGTFIDDIGIMFGDAAATSLGFAFGVRSSLWNILKGKGITKRAGKIVTQPMVTASAASSVWNAFAFHLRDAIGESMTNPKKSFGQAWEDSEYKGTYMDGLSLILTPLGMKAPEFINYVKKKAASPNKTVLADDLFGLIGDQKKLDEALDLLAEIRKREQELLLKSKINFSVAEASDDVIKLGKVRAFEKSSNARIKRIVDNYGQDQANALNAFFHASKKSFTSDTIYGAPEGEAKLFLDDLIRDVLEKRVSGVKNEAIKLQQKSANNLTDVDLRFNNGSYKQAGETITTAIEDVHGGILKSFQNRYKKLNDLRISGKPSAERVLSGDEITKVYDEFLETARKSQVPEKEISAFFKNPRFKTDANDVVSPREGFTLDELRITMSKLLEKDREIFKGGKFPTGYPQKFIEAIDNTLKKELGPEDPWLKEYIKIGEDYKLFKSEFDGIAQRLLTVKSGRLKIADEDVFETYFLKGKNQDGRIDQILNILKRAPGQTQVFRENTEAFYRQAITKPDGTFDLKKHQQFMKDYGDSLNKIFGVPKFFTSASSKFSDMEKALGVMSKSTKKYNDTLDALAKTTEGKLLKNDASTIYSTIWKNESPRQLKDVINILKQSGDDEVLKALKTTVIDDLRRNSLETGSEYIMKPTKWIEAYKTNQDKLKILFKDDPQYLRDLDLYTKAQIVQQRKYSSRVTPTEPIFIPPWLSRILRTNVAPPLSKEGRTLTAVSKTLDTVMGKRMATIVSRPDLLKQYNQFQKMVQKGDIKSPEFITLRDRLIPTYLLKEIASDLYPDEGLPFVPDEPKSSREEIEKINSLKGGSSKLSQDPINVATTENMAPAANMTANMAPTNVAMNSNQGGSGIASIKNSGIANDPNQKARYDMAFGDKGIV